MGEQAKPIPQTPYQLLGGDDGVRRLALKFYEVMDRLPEAHAIRTIHKDDLGTVAEKLYEFLSGWLGGPPLYLQRHGTVCLTKPHAPYAIGEAERDQWLMCMDRALDEVNASDDVKAMLKRPMFELADIIRNR